MGIWDKFFGNKKKTPSDKSPYLPPEEDPVDIGFAKNFTQKGGRFLFCETAHDLVQSFKEICIENQIEINQIACLNPLLSQNFSLNLIDQISGKLTGFKAALIDCEYLISNTGKILLSEYQIKHFKLSELPQIIIVKAATNQLVRDVSHGMTSLKNKYPNAIPTNITTLKIKAETVEEEIKLEAPSTSPKSIYLLLEDS